MSCGEKNLSSSLHISLPPWNDGRLINCSLRRPTRSIFRFFTWHRKVLLLHPQVVIMTYGTLRYRWSWWQALFGNHTYYMALSASWAHLLLVSSLICKRASNKNLRREKWASSNERLFRLCFLLNYKVLPAVILMSTTSHFYHAPSYSDSKAVFQNAYLETISINSLLKRIAPY